MPFYPCFFVPAGCVADGKLVEKIDSCNFVLWITAGLCGFRGLEMRVSAAYIRLPNASIVKTQNSRAIKDSEKIMLVGAIAAVGWFLWRKGSAAGNLVFSPGGISNASISNSTPSATFGLIVQNTSDSDLLLNSLAANVFSNGTLIGNVSNFTGVSIPANGQTVIPLTVTMQPIGLVSELLNGLENNTLNQALTMTGNANVNAVQIPVNLSYTLSV